MNDREINSERSPVPRFAIAKNVAAMLLDYSIYCGKAQSRAFTRSSVVKNGSNIRDMVSLSMPAPVSETDSRR